MPGQRCFSAITRARYPDRSAVAGTWWTAGILAGSPGRTYTVRADGVAWRVRTGPGQFVVEDGAGDGVGDLTVSGAPAPLLRWMWNREGTGEPSGVTVDGSAEAADELRRCITTATS